MATIEIIASFSSDVVFFNSSISDSFISASFHRKAYSTLKRLLPHLPPSSSHQQKKKTQTKTLRCQFQRTVAKTPATTRFSTGFQTPHYVRGHCVFIAQTSNFITKFY